jgi:hypothetical protein
MTELVSSSVREEESSGSSKLAFLLAMAMFVLVVDTRLGLSSGRPGVSASNRCRR